ncbi:hypothetical protein HNV12_07585 [Methanococcoides sp. SA1]|nr:hypothetical protein [Methanococcoides sp. SA1]
MADDDKITFRQKNYIRKCLMFKQKRELIQEFCEVKGITWLEISKIDASVLIGKLIKL